MKFTENELETRLRQAPRPEPPVGIRKQLIDNIVLAPELAHDRTANPSSRGWQLFWKPILAGTTVMIVCAAALGVQQGKIRELRHSIAVLEEQAQSANQAKKSPANQAASVDGMLGANLSSDRTDLEELPKIIDKLKAGIETLRSLREENQKLRAQLSAIPGLTEEENKALQQAKERAQNLYCVNTLKNLGLAARLFATDNDDTFPPDVLSMTNEITTPKYLWCPADTQRVAAASFQEFSQANMSYEYLAPSGNSTEPNQVLFRCPIHTNICLVDGSVQRAAGMADRFAQRDGKLYFGDPRQPAKAKASPGAGMSDAMRKRYGLPPASVQPETATQPE